MSFDPLRYIASYPDLIAAFGLDTAAATTHYNTFGLAEGRSVSFDPLRYIASHFDLITAFGTDTAAATTHFIANGYAEGRTLSFDALRYTASYPDLPSSTSQHRFVPLLSGQSPDRSRTCGARPIGFGESV